MFQSTICVVAREDWREYCQVCKCPSDNDAGFNAYVARIEAFHARAKADGHEVKTVLLRPSELLTWCESRSLEVNSMTRKKFVAEKLAQMEQEGEADRDPREEPGKLDVTESNESPTLFGEQSFAAS